MNTRTKIAFFNNNLYGGGAERILQTLLHNLSPERYDITLFGVVEEEYDTSIYPKYVTYKSLFKKGTTSSFLHRITSKIKGKLDLKTYTSDTERFYREKVRERYDVEIAFIEGYSTRIVASSNNPESLKIAWVHIDLEANPWSQIAYTDITQEKNSYERIDHVVCVSQNVKEAFQRKFSVATPITVKYNPVDRKAILRKAQEPIKISAPENQIPVLVTLGRLEEQKGYGRLVDCVSRLQKENIAFELWILGEGSQRTLLEDKINTLQLQSQVKLLGFKENPYPYLKKADIFVCSSYSEGFSTVVTEALILGKPIVTTNCSGMEELLGATSQYGLITENSEEALYQGIKRLVTDKTLQLDYKEKSKQRGANFEIETTVHAIENLWHS